jgi:hypothetical protein
MVHFAMWIERDFYGWEAVPNLAEIIISGLGVLVAVLAYTLVVIIWYPTLSLSYFYQFYSLSCFYSHQATLYSVFFSILPHFSHDSSLPQFVCFDFLHSLNFS